ncbi:ABC transporter substrate-binding protein [Arthrobacter sp. HMWF013]|uniref:ABC transporter substrate-binding protein n=1 Tax=Arthrobacter sp. HMWF013 TaxID=2056849 RepID=UPI0015E7F42F|nr:ABC transporter substrate-binding protein [Arthrobacter sp. HMWF013]
MTIAQGVDPTTMNPLQQRETSTSNVLRHMYDPLVTRNPKDPSKYEPDLATSWKQVDAITYEFTLADGVKFSDGSTFDAADVKYTVDAMLGTATGKPTLHASNFKGLKGAEVVDAHTVRFLMSTPSPLFMPRLPNLFMIPEGSLDADPAALDSKPIGTGPYTLKTWDRNSQVVLDSRSDYFRGAARIPSVTFKTIADNSARMAGLGSGDIDLVTNLAPDSVPEVEGAGNAVVKQSPSARIATIWLNTRTEGPLQNRDVRLAMNHAVDMDTIIKTVMGGYGSRVATFTPDYFVGYDEANKPLKYDPELAKKLLADAGYADGFSMEMMVPAGRYPFAEQVSQAIQSNLAEVGIKVKLNIVEFGVFADATNSGNVPESYYAAYGNSTFNPIAEYLLAARTGKSGYSLYSDPSLDALIDQAAVTVDPTQQDALISQVEKKLLADAPFLYLYSQVDLYGVSQRLVWEPSVDESVYMYDAETK